MVLLFLNARSASTVTIFTEVDAGYVLMLITANPKIPHFDFDATVTPPVVSTKWIQRDNGINRIWPPGAGGIIHFDGRITKHDGHILLSGNSGDGIIQI